MEHLQSSGTKVLLLFASYLIGKTQRDTDLEDEFKVIYVVFFVMFYC